MIGNAGAMPPLFPMSAKVTALRGVGPVFAAALQEAGTETIRDLLLSLPIRYLDRGSVLPMGQLGAQASERDVVTVVGILRDLRQTVSRVQRMPLTEALIEDETGSLRLVWFNQPHLGRSLRKGDRLVVFGTLSAGRHGLEMRGPQFETLGHLGEAEPWVRRFLPVYRRLGPISGRMRARLVQEALAKVAAPEEVLPLDLATGLPTTLDALRLLHQPDDSADGDELGARDTPAHGRLATEELFAFSLGLSIRRSGRLARRGALIPTGPDLRERLRAYLPFRLTGAQREAFREIAADLTSGRVMHRLLQGDVGSGKTLVAFLAMAMVAETGGQAALLAPTEVLARQHAATLQRLLGADSRLQLLLGGMKVAERREALARIVSGEASYVVGTHALFQESVTFQKLQLVVVDEQHRFGVRQRESIKEKGLDPHWLVMSATPIPRSLALALFGDLEQSVLDELPPGRQPITTRLLPTGGAHRAWDLVARELAAGHQAFVVSPAIDPQDETSKVVLRDIQAMEALLKARFPEVEIAVIHGRLRADALSERMARFVAGEARILLATTVIEVGVDVPNATVMVVDHAERFGLSQLHQLRGRVGRGGAHSHFVMISDSETERLRILVESQDGFRIAQKDLELRGPGEFFGTRQSGLPQFQVADLIRDRQLLSKCRAAAERALARGLTEGQKGWLRLEGARLRLADVG
jgi:ATP-dependent DNA helicase RecG